MTEGMNHSSVTEESLNLKDELDTSVDDRPSYLKSIQFILVSVIFKN